MKLNSDPRLPIPDSTLDYLRRLNVRLYELWRTLTTAVNERVTAQENGEHKGSQPVLNFIGATVVEDPENGRINVTVGEGGGGTGCCYTNSAYEEPTTIAVQSDDESYTERPDWVYVPYGNLTDGCSALVTASLSIEMWPSTPACPPTTVWAELWVRYPDDDEEKLSARHYLRAPTYTPEACGADPEIPYPVIMNVALTGRHRGSDYESGRYYYFWRVCYLATGLDEELYPKVWWDMHVGVFPCAGYQPT